MIYIDTTDLPLESPAVPNHVPITLAGLPLTIVNLPSLIWIEMARDRRTYAEHVRLDDRCYDLRARIPSCSSFGSEEVDFDGRDDVSDPKNWSPTYKWSLLAVVSLISLSMYALP